MYVEARANSAGVATRPFAFAASTMDRAAVASRASATASEMISPTYSSAAHLAGSGTVE